MQNGLRTIASINSPICRFEMAEGNFPKPVEVPWVSRNPILTTMYVDATFRAEGRFSGVHSSGYSRLGRTFFLAPNRELMGRGSGGRLRIARCLFDPDAYRRVTETDDGLTHDQLRRGLDLESGLIDSLMRRLADEALSPGWASDLLVESLGTALLIEFCRVIHDNRGTPEEPRSGFQPRHRRMIEEYLEGIESGSPGIDELAQICGFSSHYFSRLFRQSTGQSIGQFLADWRLSRAKQLLGDSGLPLKEVAFRLGFANAANFSTAFSKRTGMTPGDYRKKRVLGGKKNGSGAQ